MPSQGTGQISTTLARNIRAARESADLTQRELAEHLDVDSVLVSKWERARHRPNNANLAAIAQRFGRDVAWFYTDHEKTPDRAAA